MKKLLTLFSVVFLFGTISAQIAPNSIAPDFTATDINGNTYNLYEILESGRPVIMDVSATWCGPCWSYHNTQALETIYTELGPNGTNEAMVLFVEGDPSTNTNCLYGSAGCNATTQGNWVANTPYPIFDNAGIGDAYEVGYFPTVYLICTNHLVREVGQLSAAALKTAINNCPEPTPGAAISPITFGTDYAFGRICGMQSITPSFLVLNNGTDTLKSVVIELKVNGQTVQTLDYTTPIPSFFPRQIDFAPVAISNTAIIKATIKSLNGTTLTTPVVKQKSYSKAKATTSKSLTLDLLTDGFALETYWEVIDEQGNVYGFGGNENVGPNGANTGTPTAGPGAYSNFTAYTEVIEVPENGCYFLHVVDSDGDGLCGSSNAGFFKLSETANPANLLTEGSCGFGDSYNIFGAEGIVGTSDLLLDGSFRVFPNPAKDKVNVNFSVRTAADVQITVTNALGQVVRNLGNTAYGAGLNTTTIETTSFASGLYVVSLRTAEGTISRTFSVKQ